MADYFCQMIKDINKKQFDIYYTNKDKYDEKFVKKAKKDYDGYYWSFERAYDRAHQVKELIEFADNSDFEYLALMNLSNAKHCIEGLGEKEHELTYDEFNTHKYDDILIDYWKKVREKPQEYDIWKKYSHIDYRRNNINLGLIDDIQYHRHLVQDSIDFTDEEKEKELLIIDRIEELIKQLNDYIPNYGENMV